MPVQSHITIPLFLDDLPVGVLVFYSLNNPIKGDKSILESIERNTYSVAMILKSILLYEGIYRDFRNIKRIHINFQKEIQLAQKIQSNLLPKTSPHLNGVKVESWYHPMEDLGGDFYDYIVRRENDGIGFFISDVAGHGVPSALITTMIKSLLGTYRSLHKNPMALMQKINSSLFENNVSNFFVTAFYLFLDIKNQRITYTSAAHGEMILYRRSEEKIIRLKTRGKFLGVFADASWGEDYLDVKSGDRILLYTDGITEMFNRHGEEFGVERLINLLMLSRNIDSTATKNFLIRNIINFENHLIARDDKAFILIDIT